MEVLNLFPFLSLDVFNNSLNCLINTDSNYSNFVTPSASIMFKHFLVVSHRALAGTTPGSPEVDEEDLSLLVGDGLHVLGPDVHHVHQVGELVAHLQAAADAHLSCLWI